jgi:SAM-dependent methyltransferase
MSPDPSGRFQSWEDAVRWLRSQPDRQDLVRGAYYDDPLPTAAERYRSSEEWNEVCSHLPGRTCDVLDVGAGRGIASYAFARRGDRVFALEPDPSALVGAAAIRTLADTAGLQISVSEKFSESLPYEDRSFDVVFARAVLHHTSDLVAACREFRRVLRPGGRLIAVREHVISRTADLPIFLESHPLHRLYGGENAFMLAAYKGAIRGAGLRLLKCYGPTESAMNFSPTSLSDLQTQVAQRLVCGVPGLTGLARHTLAVPLVWKLARRLLTIVDGRPGRLYSFVADRPSA